MQLGIIVNTLVKALPVVLHVYVWLIFLVPICDWLNCDIFTAQTFHNGDIQFLYVTKGLN